VNSAPFDQAVRLKSGIPRPLIKRGVLVDAARISMAGGYKYYPRPG
jgi:hypothetical protein